MRVFESNYIGVHFKNPIDKSLGAGNNLRDWQIYVLQHHLLVNDKAIIDSKPHYHSKLLKNAKKRKEYLKKMIEIGKKHYDESDYASIVTYDNLIEAIDNDDEKLREKIASGKLVVQKPKNRRKRGRGGRGGRSRRDRGERRAGFGRGNLDRGARGRGARGSADEENNHYSWNPEQFEMPDRHGVPRLVDWRNAFDDSDNDASSPEFVESVENLVEFASSPESVQSVENHVEHSETPEDVHYVTALFWIRVHESSITWSRFWRFFHE